jgi:predicted short-subunit dehydrogenase-like oxidoreductase (DUF2520 family)
MARSKKLQIAIIGAGKVGSVLGKILAQREHTITAVISRSVRSARAAGRFLRCPVASTALRDIPSGTGIVFIATPHDAIVGVARALSRLDHLDFRHLSACHTSGIHTAAALDTLKERGATVFSFHPLQTFPRGFSPAKILPHGRGIFYGVDGTPSGVRMARMLAKELGGKVVIIPPEMRALYHAACVAASNHLTTVLWVVEQIFKRVRGDQARVFPVFRPIVEAALSNIGRSSPAEALSGPIVRGGIETVTRHFELLQTFMPELLPYFVGMSLETLRLAETECSMDRGTADAMRHLILSYSPSLLTPQENH